VKFSRRIYVSVFSVFVLLGVSIQPSAQEISVSRSEFQILVARVNALESENKSLKSELAERDLKTEALLEKNASKLEASNESLKNQLVAKMSYTAPAEKDRSSAGFVGISPEYSYKILDHAERTNTKLLYQLQARRSGLLPSRLTLGGQVTALANWQDANEDTKFGWLMRHPTSANQIGKSVSEAVVHSANLNMTANVTDDITAYVEMLYNPEQNFAAGSTIVGLGRNNVNVRRAWVMWGNLEKSPFYAAIGKMDIPFGWNDTVSPFTNSTNWHSFAGLAYGAQVGYSNDKLNLRFMGIQGGAQFRNANSPVEGTSVPSKLNNFAFDANYLFDLNTESTLLVGTSYQYGSGYCQEYVDTPGAGGWTTGSTLIPGVTRNAAPQGVRHFEGCQDPVGALDVYADLRYKKFQLIGEFATTLEDWPGTRNPYIPQFSASKNQTFTVGGKYSASVPMLPNDISLSVEFSRFKAGDDGSDWEKQDQLVFGSSYYISPSVNLFGEAILVDGWVPLNFLSGGNPGGLVGESWSSQSSENTILNFGIQAGF